MSNAIQPLSLVGKVIVCKCGWEINLDLETPWVLTGALTNGNIVQEINIQMCEACASEIGDWKAEI